MPRIKKEAKLAIDVLDMLFHIMVRSVNEKSVNHLSLFIDIKEDISSMMDEGEHDEYETVLLEFYAICLFQIRMLSHLPSGTFSFFDVRTHDMENGDLSYDDIKKVERAESDFVCCNSISILEKKAFRKGVDVAEAHRISEYLFDKYRDVHFHRPDVFFIDLPVKVILFSDFFCLLKLLPFFSKRNFFECGRVKKEYEKESFIPVLVLALYRELNQSIASGISDIYRFKIKSLRKSTVFVGEKEVEISVLNVNFNENEVKYNVFKRVVKSLVDGEGGYSEGSSFPLSSRPLDDVEIIKLMEFATEDICYRIFSKGGKQHRIDRVVSMIGGYYLYLGLAFIEKMDELPIIHSSIIGRFDSLNENKSSSSLMSGHMKKAGISVSPNVLYREYLSGKKGLYSDIPSKWVSMLGGENNFYGFGVFLNQVVSGSFEYMKE